MDSLRFILTCVIGVSFALIFFATPVAGATCVIDASECLQQDSQVIENDSNGTEGQLGVCVIGVDSPCNSDTRDIREIKNNNTTYVTEPGPKLGVCVIGVDSQCNTEGYYEDNSKSNPNITFFERIIDPLYDILGIRLH